MKRIFPFYAAFILISTPALWCFSIGLAHGLFNGFLLSVGSPRPFDTTIRIVSLWMAAGSPLVIWPVAGAFSAPICGAGAGSTATDSEFA